MAAEKYIPGIILCVLGFLFTTFGYYKSIKPINIRIMNSAVTSGVITSDQTRSGYVTGDYPVAEYTISPGNEVYKEPVRQAGRVMRFKQGERVKLYYDIKNPSEVMLGEINVLYNDAAILLLFALPFFLFGFSLLALGILKRDSFFDISKQLKNGIPPSVKHSVKIISGTCVILMILKLYNDIPVCIHTIPYFFITFAFMFVLNITSFLVLLNLKNRK